VRGYRCEDAETVVVLLGSMLGTLEDVVDELRERGERVGALAIRCLRPWPAGEVRAALAHTRRVIVLEKAFAVGIGGIVGQNVRLALDRLGIRVHDVMAGLGGRAITAASLRAMFEDELGALTFLDTRAAARPARREWADAVPGRIVCRRQSPAGA
jgi:pyruvate ferredoxin oxidoreductase alpha subunit